jgi:hypothetical protein
MILYIFKIPQKELLMSFPFNPTCTIYSHYTFDKSPSPAKSPAGKAESQAFNKAGMAHSSDFIVFKDFNS